MSDDDVDESKLIPVERMRRELKRRHPDLEVETYPIASDPAEKEKDPERTDEVEPNWFLKAGNDKGKAGVEYQPRGGLYGVSRIKPGDKRPPPEPDQIYEADSGYHEAIDHVERILGDEEPEPKDKRRRL